MSGKKFFLATGALVSSSALLVRSLDMSSCRHIHNKRTSWNPKAWGAPTLPPSLYCLPVVPANLWNRRGLKNGEKNATSIYFIFTKKCSSLESSLQKRNLALAVELVRNAAQLARLLPVAPLFWTAAATRALGLFSCYRMWSPSGLAKHFRWNIPYSRYQYIKIKTTPSTTTKNAFSTTAVMGFPNVHVFALSPQGSSPYSFAHLSRKSQVVNPQPLQPAASEHAICEAHRATQHFPGGFSPRMEIGRKWGKKVSYMVYQGLLPYREDCINFESKKRDVQSCRKAYNFPFWQQWTEAAAIPNCNTRNADIRGLRPKKWAKKI